jgi:hypothetical protein
MKFKYFKAKDLVKNDLPKIKYILRGREDASRICGDGIDRRVVCLDLTKGKASMGGP